MHKHLLFDKVIELKSGTVKLKLFSSFELEYTTLLAKLQLVIPPGAMYGVSKTMLSVKVVL